jgi:predicted permease
MEGQPQVPIGQRPIITIQTISPRYAEVMRVPLLAGREFSDHDEADGPSIAIVNETLANQYWPNENAIGKHVWLGKRTTPTEIVGMFGDVKNSGLADRPQPELMLPFPQLPWATLNLSVRTAVEPHSVVTAVRDAISKTDPDQPITRAETLEEILVTAKAQPRFTTLLLGVFSGVALLLAVVGIYGVIGYSVAQRTQEMGIRLALGASREGILRLVVAYGLGLAAIGIVIGLAGAAALTRLMSTQLYQTSVFDPLTFIASAGIFLLAALLASYLPALRAMRIDPVDAIRYE